MTLEALKFSGYSNFGVGKNATEESFDELLEAIGGAVGMLMDLIMFILEERS